MLGEAEDLGWRVGDSDKCFKISNQIVTVGGWCWLTWKYIDFKWLPLVLTLYFLIDNAKHKIKSRHDIHFRSSNVMLI